MPAEKLLPTPAIIRVAYAEFRSNRITLRLYAIQRDIPCPYCHWPSSRVHSRYTRKLADLPWAGIAVIIFLTVRRFFCDNPACQRLTFTEQVPELAAAFAQRTVRLAAAQRSLAWELGGEAGARTANRLGLATSADTLLRLIRRSPEFQITAPRVLGIDDWAFKRGHTYGTLLIDLETRRPIDLLPNRTTDAVIEWLQQHPSIEIIARDRAGAYAEAASRGAPQAIQVADRFHLLMNLRQAVERFFDRHQADLRKVKLVRLPKAATAASPQHPGECGRQTAPRANPEVCLGAADRRRARYDEVRQLKQQGASERGIARTLHLSRTTVRRYLRADEFPVQASHPFRLSKAAAYGDYLRARWSAGCRSSRQLYHELCQQGFGGSESSVYRFVSHLRSELSDEVIAGGAVTGGQATPSPNTFSLSSRQAAWLLIRPLEELKDSERDWLEQIQALCQPVLAAHDLAQQFACMVKQRLRDSLAPWLQAAKSSGLPDLRNPAIGLQRDLSAVSAALSLPWSNGPTEGHIHRLKMIKRQMYGRAKFDLLRKRVLQAC